MQLELFAQLIILFTVIFDPPGSFAVFVTASGSMDASVRRRAAINAVAVAAGLSLLVLLLGAYLLELFSTTLDEFRVAGGLILGLLGIRMAVGPYWHKLEGLRNDGGHAVASIIGTPLLTGPAAITAIIVSSTENGMLITGLAVAVVLGFTAILLHESHRLHRLLGRTAIQVMSTLFGLVTLAWSVKFVTTGLTGIFGW